MTNLIWRQIRRKMGGRSGQKIISEVLASIIAKSSIYASETDNSDSMSSFDIDMVELKDDNPFAGVVARSKKNLGKMYK